MVEFTKPASRVTVIGTGAIGSAVAHRLLGRGREVTVWNRSESRVTELVDVGALPSRSVQDAVSSSTLVLLTVSDHAAAHQALTQLDLQLAGRTIVGMYTGSPDEARLAARQVTRLGGLHLDAGIQASPEMIGTDAATILYSGSRHAFGQHEATLELLSRPRFVGEAPEAAAVWDLALFGVWYDAQLGLLRALDAAREAGLDVEEFAHTASTQLGHVSTAVPATVSEIQQAIYPRGPADLTEHLAVVRRLVELRAGRPLGDGGLRQVAARVEALIEDGHGGEGLTATVGH